MYLALSHLKWGWSNCFSEVCFPLRSFIQFFESMKVTHGKTAWQVLPSGHFCDRAQWVSTAWNLRAKWWKRGSSVSALVHRNIWNSGVNIIFLPGIRPVAQAHSFHHDRTINCCCPHHSRMACVALWALTLSIWWGSRLLEDPSSCFWAMSPCPCYIVSEGRDCCGSLWIECL